MLLSARIKNMENRKYNIEWFTNRAFESLHRIAPHTWDYSDSLLLYISSGAEKYEQLQETDTPYFILVTQPEREYLKSIARDVVARLPQKFEYIDLGPGTEHKEQFFFDEIKKQGKECTYIPVDISGHYLTLAEIYAKDQGISVQPIQSSFEELPEILGTGSLPRFVNIGATFANYNPQAILDLLKRIAGKDGYVFINTQIRNRVDMDALQKAYAKDAASMADEKIKLLGLNPDTDVTRAEANDSIEVWSSIMNVNPTLKERGVEGGDKLLLFQSLRYTPEQLEAEIKKVFEKYELLDTESSFVAALINM